MDIIPLKKYPSYGINPHGQVWSFSKEKYLVSYTSEKGYSQVRLYVEGKYTWRTVHRWVAEAFIPNQENKPQVNHKDGNKLNNHVDNLEWVTAKENTQHAWTSGLHEATRESCRRVGSDKLIREKIVESLKKRVLWKHPEKGFIYASASELVELYPELHPGKLSLVLNKKRPHHKDWRVS